MRLLALLVLLVAASVPMWHQDHIRPFHFFQATPVLDLPTSLSVQP